MDNCIITILIGIETKEIMKNSSVNQKKIVNNKLRFSLNKYLRDNPPLLFAYNNIWGGLCYKHFWLNWFIALDFFKSNLKISI